MKLTPREQREDTWRNSQDRDSHTLTSPPLDNKIVNNTTTRRARALHKKKRGKKKKKKKTWVLLQEKE
jgi:hypothetical protein